MKIKSTRMGIVPALCALPGALLLGCSKPAPLDEPIRAVKLVTVGVSGVQTEPEFSGEVRARAESRLGFRVSGKLLARKVELGQHVKAGQLLAQLDPADLRLAADAAKAQASAAATNRHLAGADFKRFKELKEQNFISGAELERRQAALDAAQAQLEQAQAQLSAQRNQAGYANLVADVSGVVTGVDIERGQVVAAGNPVLRIAQDGPRDVVFSVPEDKVALIKPGSKVRVRQWARAHAMQGTVREVAASADPVTRTYQIKLALELADPAARPPLGATVFLAPVALSHSGPSVIKLPTSALKQDGKSSGVWVLDAASMTVKSQAVVIATADQNEVVIASGLAPGMQVVVAGVHVLTQGQKVSIYKDKYARNLAPTQAPSGVAQISSVALPLAGTPPAAASQ